MTASPPSGSMTGVGGGIFKAMKYKDYTNQTFNYLRMKAFIRMLPGGYAEWICECVRLRNGQPCGNTRVAKAKHVRGGYVKACRECAVEMAKEDRRLNPEKYEPVFKGKKITVREAEPIAIQPPIKMLCTCPTRIIDGKKFKSIDLDGCPQHRLFGRVEPEKAHKRQDYTSVGFA